MNKIVIFGATGMTGLCVADAALKRGLKIRALVRDPSKVPEELEGKVEIIKGDVLNIDDVKKAVEGQHAVVVTLGTRNNLEPTTDMSNGLRNILSAMKTANISVVSICLSAFLFYEPAKVPKIFHEINADHQRMYDILKESDLNWIAVFPPHISAESPRGYITKHGASTGLREISKYDLGKFFVDCLFQSEHYQKVIGIASNPA